MKTLLAITLVAPVFMLAQQQMNAEDSKVLGLGVIGLVTLFGMHIRLSLKVTSIATKQELEAKSLEKIERQISRMRRGGGSRGTETR